MVNQTTLWRDRRASDIHLNTFGRSWEMAANWITREMGPALRANGPLATEPLSTSGGVWTQLAAREFDRRKSQTGCNRVDRCDAPNRAGQRRRPFITKGHRGPATLTKCLRPSRRVRFAPIPFVEGPDSPIFLT